MKLHKNPGFTLMELMIIVSLIAIIATAVLILFNPLQQINKARDSKRKSELNALKKTFEDFYNDKSCYPQPSEVCYNAKSEYAPSEAITCNICGNNASSPSLSPYIEKLPCDPISPTKNYLYQVDDLTCPKWFRLYSELSSKSDLIINEIECDEESCGPKPFFGYDLGVASPNIDLERATTFVCYAQEHTCNNCGSYERCNDPNLARGCQLYKKFYSSYSSCCQDNNICVNTYYCTYIVTSECIQCGYNGSECNATGKCKAGTVKRGACP